jgi:hypothetical protein
VAKSTSTEYTQVNLKGANKSMIVIVPLLLLPPPLLAIAPMLLGEDDDDDDVPLHFGVLLR